MKRIATLVMALGLATAGSTALAEQAKDQLRKEQSSKPQPVQMTEAQLDNVAAGQLITIEVNDVLVNLPIQANVLLNLNAAVAVLGAAGAGQVLGNQTQTNRQ